MFGMCNPSTETVGNINPRGSTCSSADGAPEFRKTHQGFRRIQKHGSIPWPGHGNLAPSGKEKQIKSNFAESRCEQRKWFVLPSSTKRYHYICLKKILCRGIFKLQLAACALSFSLSPDVKFKLISQQKCRDCCPWTMHTTSPASLADATWSPTRGNKALQGNRNWRCMWARRNAP